MDEAVQEERVTKEHLQELVDQIKQQATVELSPETRLREEAMPVTFALGLGVVLGTGTYLVVRGCRGPSGKPMLGKSGATLAAVGAGVVGAGAGAIIAQRLGW